MSRFLPFTEKLLHLHCSVFKVQSESFAFVVGLSGLEPPTSRLSGVRSDLLSYKPLFFRRRPRPLFLTLGGDEENRTPDPLLARQVLSQLSYTPKYTIKLIHLNGGHKWTRTIDLTLIRRAL